VSKRARRAVFQNGTGEPFYQCIRTYAAELIELKPDVVLACTTLNLTVVLQTTSNLLFVQVADPVKQGFVTNFRHPGGNITGFSLFEFSLGSKWLDLLKNVVPDCGG
jgi:putative tryptophan/tyrosine transport system substrate-binding protein